MIDSRIEKLHTAARRYCIEQHSHWWQAYSELEKYGRDRKGRHYTDEALRLFPRYNVLSAILTDIETFTAKDFATLQEAKEIICMAGMLAENIFTIGAQEPLAKQVMDEERNRFNQFILDLSEENLENIEPLFYRRILKKDERAQIWIKLKEAWNITEGCWYPLINHRISNVEAFQDTCFEKSFGFSRVQTLLQNHDIKMIWELREYGEEYELELSVFEPDYNGAEGYWSSVKMDWIIYISHENSIAIGGWLLDEVKKIWPDWNKCVWPSPSFEPCRLG